MTRTRPARRPLRFALRCTALGLACGLTGAITGCVFSLGDSDRSVAESQCSVEGSKSSNGALHCFYGELRTCHDGSWEKVTPPQSCPAAPVAAQVARP